MSTKEVQATELHDEEVPVMPVGEADEETTPLDEPDAEPGADLFAALEEVPEEVEEPGAAEFSADSLQLFLKDVGKVDLLTAAQEVELAKLHRARRPLREAGDGRGEPSPRRLDCEALPQTKACRSST